MEQKVADVISCIALGTSKSFLFIKKETGGKPLLEL